MCTYIHMYKQNLAEKRETKKYCKNILEVQIKIARKIFSMITNTEPISNYKYCRLQNTN